MRMHVVRRYLPFVVLVVVQVGIIAAWPSVPASDEAPAAADTRSADEGPGATAAEGDTGPAVEHCVEGRQFDPAIDFYAPPCVPTWSGDDNGGATAPGVTATDVKVVVYFDHIDPAVATIAGDLVPAVADRSAFVQAAGDFLDQHVELYGRKLSVEVVEGTCPTTPPDIACSRNEFRGIVTDRQPFAIVYLGTCAQCIDEVVQQGVVVVGGQPFTDRFARERAPYYWGAGQGGSTKAKALAELWCTNFADTPVQFSTGGPQSLNGSPRKLGVVTANVPEYDKTVDELDAAMKRRCGDSIAADYSYALDISTAAQQVQAGLDRMLAAKVTTVTAFADPIAPAFMTGFAQTSGYFPEALDSGISLQDSDIAIQQVMVDMASLACPKGNPCPFDGTVGLTATQNGPLEDSAAAKVWQATGHPGLPPYSTADILDWPVLSLVGTLLQSAGPELTAANIDVGIRRYGLRGDADHLERGFPEGSYFWGQGSQAMYWDRNAPSPVNGEPGTFVRIGEPLVAGKYPRGVFDEVPAR